MSTLRAFLFFLTLVLAMSIAGAQPVFVIHPSIELRVAEAHSVVRGTIAHLERTVLLPPNGFTNSMRIDGHDKEYRTQTSDGVVSYTITVKVDAVIKGPQRATASFVLQTFVGDNRLERWTARRAPFLCFVATTKDSVGATKTSAVPPWNAISLSQPAAAEQAVRGGVDFPPILTMNFACLDDPNEILSRARRFAKAKEKVTGTHVFEHPPLPADRMELLWTRLAVPVVPSLETTARRLIQSPGDFSRFIHGAKTKAILLEGTRNMLRAEGIAALRHFKSKKNIALLKTLLHAPAFTISHRQDDRSDAKRVYYIRKAAYETLQSWNIEVPAPLLEEPAP